MSSFLDAKSKSLILSNVKGEVERTDISVDKYIDALEASMRRYSLLRNSSRKLYGTLAASLLHTDDESIRRAFDTNPVLSDIFSLRWDAPAGKAREDDWERYFYGHLEETEERSPSRIRCLRSFTPLFLATNYDAISLPKYDNAQVDWDGTNTEAYLVDCAANYLLKNTWHNFVHNSLQGQNHTNYRNFQGLARRQMDAQADHLGTILLVLSYGLPIATIGQTKANDAIVRVLRRNRSSTVFEKRKAARKEKTTKAETEEEEEERYCRTLLNYLSGWLITRGLCPSTINVYLGPKAVQGVGRDKHLKAKQVVVELNGQIIQTQIGCKLRSKEIEKSPSPTMREHLRLIAEAVAPTYQSMLENDRELVRHVRTSLRSYFRLMKIRLEPS